MKNTLYTLALLVSLSSFGQYTKYSFLDSNLDKVSVVNTNTLTKKERKKILYYQEYYFNNDSLLIGSKVFYAKGKYPSFPNGDFDEISLNEVDLISFKNAEKREGKVRTIYEFAPTLVDPDIYTKNFGIMFDLMESITITRFFLNGQINHKTQYFKGKFKGRKITFYLRNGEIESEILFDEQLSLRKSYINYEDEYYFVTNYPNYSNSDYSTKTVEKYFKSSGQKFIKWHYSNGEELLNKRQFFSPSGREIFYPDEEVGNKSEAALREYFKNNNTPSIEGVYTVKSTKENLNYKIAVLENIEGKFIGFTLDGFFTNTENWALWEERATFERTSLEGFYNLTWIGDDKKQEVSEIIELTGGAFAEFGNYNMIKLYPEIGTNVREKRNNPNEWAGNGSGIIISKAGYIVTNHHVIEDADDIEVEFIVNGEIQNFNAEIIQSDKVNDLAIIKIFDVNFDGLDNLPYNFKTRSSDVGTKVYAYGYPMALSLMGKEIKITDGIISSKSGFDGDITTYQITAPIQGGNSGGPLFDDKGNFLGINSSGLSKEIADNVGYTIKSSYVLNLIDVLPKSIDLPSSTKLQSLPLTEQIKEISKYVVLVKVK